MENQESSANTEVPFDVEKITADDINMEDIIITSTQQRWQGQSSDIAEKTIGMNKSQITTLALNLLSTDSCIRSTGIYIPGGILCKQKLISHPDEPIKEFTMATCGCLYHQKCLEGYLLNIAKTRAKLSCPNWDCKGREIETLITQDLFKEMGKPSTPTADTTSKPADSGNQTPVDDDVALMTQLGIFSGEEQSSSKATEVAKETSDQATSPIEVVSTTPGNSGNVDDSILKDSSGQIQHRICEKCSEEISLNFPKDTVFLSCGHAVHLDCINDLRKRCPTCPSSEMMSEISTLVEPDPSDAQKKRTRESSASTEKLSSKKAKKTGGKKVSSMLKDLIEELLTDVPVPTAEENLEEASENGASIFLQLSNRIDNAETKNEDASRGLIHSYFDFGEAIFKRYKELKPERGKDGSKAIVKREVRKAIPVTKFSDEALRKRTERSKKMYKLFNTIGKEKIARIRSIPPSYVLNLTEDETEYVMAEILTA